MKADRNFPDPPHVIVHHGFTFKLGKKLGEVCASNHNHHKGRICKVFRGHRRAFRKATSIEGHFPGFCGQAQSAKQGTIGCSYK